MGAMSPVSVAASLAQQVAEALAGHRARADDPPGLPRRVRLVPLEHRHAVGLAELRHARVGDRPALHRPDRAPLRAAVPRRRRADVVADGRRAGRVRSRDDAVADVPRRHELRHALRGLARVGARLLLREVHRRRRAAADAAPRLPAAARSTRRRSRSARTRRWGRAATSSAPCTRSSASASASTGRCSRRPRTTSAGTGSAARTRRRARARSRQKTLEEYVEPELDQGLKDELKAYVDRRRTELG